MPLTLTLMYHVFFTFHFLLVLCLKLLKSVFILILFVFVSQTDLCTSENLPEVEFITLIGDTIPRYKLRADTLTSFSGDSLKTIS